MVALPARKALLAASKLFSLGFAVIWLRSPTQSERWTKDGPVAIPPERRGKSPVADGWSRGDALTYEDLADLYGEGEPGYNVGIRTGRVGGAGINVIVLDLDSEVALAWAKENLPETQIRVRTRAGEHWYYRAPPRRVGNRVKIYVEGAKLDLDVRGDGGLVVGPSSVHGTGIVYSAPIPWTPERVESMPLFDPSWFGSDAAWEGVEDPAILAGGERRPPVYVDASLKRRRALKYLEGSPGSIAGQGTASAECLYLARALVFGLCLAPEDAASIMHRSEWNGRAVDSKGEPYPWTPDELLHKCRDAYRLAFDKPYGWMLLEERGEKSGKTKEVDASETIAAVVAEAADIERLAASYDFDLPEDLVENPGEKRWPFTDTGNAERLVARFGEYVRFVEDRKVWAAWNPSEGRWVFREIALERASKTTARKIAEELPPYELRLEEATSAALSAPADTVEKAEADEDLKRAREALAALRGWQKASEGAGRRRSMVQMAASEPSIAVSSETFDRHPLLLNVRNGVLDLREDATERLRKHDRDLYLSKVALVDWDPGARADTWEKCLRQWMGGDEEVVGFLARAAGYALTGSVEEEAFFVFTGGGQNGKSTFLNALASVLGPYAMTAPAGLLMETRVDKATPSQQAGLAALVGARLVIASETEDSASLSEAQAKAIACRDRISAKRMYEAPFDFSPTHHVFVMTQHKPSISGTDDGIWRRIYLVEWLVQISAADRDNKLAEKLLAERAGILRWAVEGCFEWQRRGLDPPKRVRDALAKYREDQDTFSGFFSDVLVRDPNGRAKKTDVREAYDAWCADNGAKPFGPKRFAAEFGKKGVVEVRTSGDRFWGGVRFKGKGD